MSPERTEHGPTRGLSNSERTLLGLLLAEDFPGSAELRQQAQHVLVREIDKDGSLAIFVSESQQLAEVLKRIPVEGTTVDEDGVTIHILLHVQGGWLTELEIYREDSRPLSRAVDVSQVRLVAP